MPTDVVMAAGIAERFPISVAALHDACTKYSATGWDHSYVEFKAATASRPNLARPDHRHALHRWLNAWGCRIAYPTDSGPDLFDLPLAEWWRKSRMGLPRPAVRLADLTDAEIDRLVAAYADLWHRPVARGRRPGLFRTLASTGSAKTLWVLRPQAVTAWDARIAISLHGGRDEAAFASHLHLARACARSLLAEAGGEQALLEAVGRPDTSVAKLLDEYWYITVSRG